jgi:non-canonical purine NTP pyrophosphatase (RdgB/HAM1 family)
MGLKTDMNKITFITGNIHKASMLQEAIGFKIEHHNLDLTEIQSLDLEEIIIHKVKEAFSHLNSPVLVHDTALYFNAWGQLPGPFIKWFLETVGNEGMCQMLDNFTDRSAVAVVNLGYYDGKDLKVFKAQLNGKIASKPVGKGGFGWDPIFIPEGFYKSRSELSEEEYLSNSLTHKLGQEVQEYLKQKND